LLRRRAILSHGASDADHYPPPPKLKIRIA
jgi:hypothetical protein